MNKSLLLCSCFSFFKSIFLNRKEKVEIDLKMQINESKAKFEEKKENAIKEANQIKVNT